MSKFGEAIVQFFSVGSTTTATNANTAAPLPMLGMFQDSGGTAVAVKTAAPLPVVGPLTDTELRASEVAVGTQFNNSGGTAIPVSTAAPLPVVGPLTDTELRAAEVDVGTQFNNSGGTAVPVATATPLPVIGPLTNTELRATDVDVLLVDPADATRKVEFDPIFRAPIGIDTVHHEIHEGDNFIVQEGIQLNNAAKVYLIVTPNTTKWAHMVISVTGSQDTSVSFIEGTTHTGGTAMTEVDRNRNTANSAGVVVTHTPAGALGGTTTLFSSQWGIPTVGGGKGGSGGGDGLREEFVLAQDESYALTVTALSANANNITVSIDFYEHTSG